MEFIFLFIPSGLNPYLIFNRGPISAPAQLNPILLLFNRGSSGRWYQGSSRKWYWSYAEKI